MSEHEEYLLSQACGGQVPEHVKKFYEGAKFALDRISGGDFSPQSIAIIVSMANSLQSLRAPTSSAAPVAAAKTEKPKVKPAPAAPSPAEGDADPFGG